MMHFLTHADGLATLVTLIVLEIVLGIDNLVFIAILVDRVEVDKQGFTRRLGLGLAMFTRIGLLTTMSFLAHLTAPLFTIPSLEFAVTGRDLVLLGGGLFLVYKATSEIHESLEVEDEDTPARPKKSVAQIVGQIVLIDIIFSLDSVITAVGIADSLAIMIAAVVISVLAMIWFSGFIANFINNNPSIKMLALSFLLVIGVMLLLEGTHHHVDKGYVYFAMGFSLAVEMLNLTARKKRKAARRLKRLRMEG
jgi:predicted tellurium resistance membrane protein TerC